MLKTREVESEDSKFLFEVYAISRMGEVSAWGWNQVQIEQFLQMQYQCQQRSYELNYPNLETRIIVYENEKVGRLLFADSKEQIVIVDITLLPKFQNKGIGSNIILGLIKTVIEHDKVLQLSVFHNNHPAKRLYERLGFQQVSSTDMYMLMEWSVEGKERTV